MNKNLQLLGEGTSERPISQSVTSNLSGELTSNLSDSKEFLKGKRGLIIDENYDSLFYAQTLISKLGSESVVLEDLDYAVNSMNNKKIDFVLFCPRFKQDCSEILQEDLDFINFMKENYNNIPIISYTARVMSNEIELQKSVGFTDIIKKPIMPEEFNHSLKKNLRPDLQN